MDFTKGEIVLLSEAKGFLEEAAKNLTLNSIIQSGVKDPEDTLANFFLRLDFLKRDFSNLDRGDLSVLTVFLVVLQKQIPNGQDSQKNFDLFMGLIGKLGMILNNNNNLN